MFEHRSQPLLGRRAFLKRQLRFFLYGSVIVGASLLIGAVGYHLTARLGWIDSFLNASMILTGMGPVDPMPDDRAKIFATLYALYSGVAFLSSIAVLLAPFMHRLMHRLHLVSGRGD